MSTTSKNRSMILVPYAEDPNLKSSANMKDKDKRFDIYMRNCCVSCLSAKVNNPNSDVALVTNATIPNKYAQLLSSNNVLILNEEFDSFRFPAEYRWGLAFYKLNALKHLVENYDYDFYAYLDADTYTQSSFDNIWEECKNNILMYDINHGLQVENYKKFLAQIKNFCGIDECVTQYGGEFFAASKENALLFVKKCVEIHSELIEKSFVTTSGDEFISTLSAFSMRDKIRNAGAYVYRFWTGCFRLVSTQYEFNPIVVLHVPDEKLNGMLKLYDYFSKKGNFPSKKRVHRILHLKYPKLKVFIRNLIFSK